MNGTNGDEVTVEMLMPKIFGMYTSIPRSCVGLMMTDK